MEQIIRQYEGWGDADPKAIRDWLVEETTVLRSARRNANELMKLLGTEVANGLASALNSAGLPLVVASLAQPLGIDFGDEETQRMLMKLGQNPAFAPYTKILRGLGQDTRTRWARTMGDAELPAVEQITEAVALAKSNDSKLLVREWRDSVLLPLVDTSINEGKSIEQIKTEIAAI